MKVFFANLEKIIALIVCLAISGGLAYFLFGKNVYIALGVSGVVGVFAAFEIRKANPGEITEKSGDVAGSAVIETLSYGLFSLVFRGLCAVVTIIVSAIMS